jgi:hypothetical protein
MLMSLVLKVFARIWGTGRMVKLPSASLGLRQSVPNRFRSRIRPSDSMAGRWKTTIDMANSSHDWLAEFDRVLGRETTFEKSEHN